MEKEMVTGNCSTFQQTTCMVIQITTATLNFGINARNSIMCKLYISYISSYSLYYHSLLAVLVFNVATLNE